MSKLPFVKMHGIGNDYVFVDGRDGLDVELAPLAVEISDRHRGVGSDGLIVALATEASDAAVRMRMFNADGSEAQMCGNGIRCLCKFAHDRLGIREAPMRIQTAAGVLSLSYTCDSKGLVDDVAVDMGAPVLDLPLVPVRADFLDQRPDGQVGICVEDEFYCMTFVSMGNPHAITVVDDVGDVNLDVIGPQIECHSAFPERINFHVVELVDRTHVVMRTWERGSGLTQACGTGASAVCVALALLGVADDAITASLPGGELALQLDRTTNHVIMTGPAANCFEGSWELQPSVAARTPIGS